MAKEVIVNAKKIKKRKKIFKVVFGGGFRFGFERFEKLKKTDEGLIMRH